MITYKESLSQTSPTKWSLRGKAVVSNGGVRMPKDSSIYLRVPLTQAYQKAISQYYKLVLEYATPPAPMEVEASTIVDIRYLKTTNEGTQETVAETCVLGTTLSKCPDTLTQVVQLPGGTADYVDIEVFSQAEHQVPIITAVNLYPSYDMTQSTLEELDRLLPAFIHSENDQTLYINDTRSTNLVSVDVDVSENTNLLAHFFVSFKSEAACTLKLQLILNEVEQKYSPLEFDVTVGTNFIGIPFSVRNVVKGSNNFRIIASTKGGVFYINPYKIQFSLDGRNLLSRTEAGNPLVRVLTNLTVDVPDIQVTTASIVKALEVNRMAVTQRIRYEIPTRLARGTVQLALARQAEHILFDGDIYNQFEIPTCMNAIGNLSFKETVDVVDDFKLVQEWPEGTCCSITIDNRQIQSYPEFEITPITRNVVEYAWLQQKPQIETEDNRYYVQNNGITHAGVFTETLATVQNLPEVTIAPVELTDEYAVIDKYC